MAKTRTRQRPVRPAVPESKYTRPIVAAAPAPAPAVPPQPQGILDSATAQQIRDLARRLWPQPASTAASRDRGLVRLLSHLEVFPAETWQQSWESSGLNGRDRPVRELAVTASHRAELTQALAALLSLRIIQPSLEAFRANRFTDFHVTFRTAQGDPMLDRFLDAVQAAETTPHYKRRAAFDVCCALTTQGIAFADLTPEAFLYYAKSTRDSGLSAYSYTTYVGHLAWDVMHALGHFPASAPSTLRAALRSPQLTTVELVDQFQLGNTPVRGMLVDYLERRRPDLDYSSLQGLARHLAQNFWKKIEQINPDQRDLRLPDDVYQQWRAAARLREDGKPRATEDGMLMSVKAMYFDIQSWAAQEPETWAIWAAPCPIPNREIRAGAKRRRRTKEKIHGRTRDLQPLLPLLMTHVQEQYQHLSELLAAGTAAEPNQLVSVGSRIYRRLFTEADQRRIRLHGTANVRLRDEESGKVVNATLAEDTAFWSWAIVETLRLTGVRREELTELSQLSIRQFQRPNGEVIALLVIAPSKSDRERVIPMSAELFHVIACIIRRLTRDKPRIPLATRYDLLERVTSAPQPFLFQRHIGQRIEVMTPGAIGEMLRRTCHHLAEKHPQFADIHFTPHDFRRLFATDLVNHGLPIHIGAALLGHLDLETTRGYVAVFEEDVVRHYQAHLAGRRAMRPEHEYRQVTNTEWEEFSEHFDKRKLELGNCGRPYSTPCSHEHACIRCPMLQLDPKMLDRLAEIEADLILRRERAETEGWLGEIEGIDLTLVFLRDKRTDAQRFQQRGLVNIGLPALPEAGKP